MNSQIEGPAIFLAQFAGDSAPFDSLQSIVRWAETLGYRGVQIPTFDKRLFDLDLAAESAAYCDEVKGICADAGIEITELSTHLQGQLVAVNPAYDLAFDAFAPEDLRGDPAARQAWAVDQVKKAAVASQRLGLKHSVGFTGSLAFPFLYPWPQRPAGLIEEAFAELGRRWTPILNAYADHGVDIGFEIHPGEDVFDGATFEMFVDACDGHEAAMINYDPSHFLLQQMDYLAFIDLYHDRISAFHVKDAEFNPDGRQGVYSGYQPWANRAGRFRSLGDGQVNFGAIFSKLTQYGYDSWAVLEWECCIKSPAQGAAEGAAFIEERLIEVTDKAFDDFAGGERDDTAIRRDARSMTRIRLGMVGGGQGAFIGAVHRIAARLDGRFDLVAGALSSDPARSAASAAELGIAADRSYTDFTAMAGAEAAREDGIEAVAIVTPNHMHAAPAIAFLQAGIHVICDKPLCSAPADAEAMAAAAQFSSARFILTHNYSGYPLVRQARAMVMRGDLGTVRIVQAEYAQDWLTDPIENEGQKQASWRTDPAKSGGGGAIGDIGTHAYHLVSFITGLKTEALAAELHSFAPGRRVDDNAHILLRFEGGARGMLWASQVAVGQENGLRMRIYGDKGGLEWGQENPNAMTFTLYGQPKQVLTRGGAAVGPEWTRIPAGHPEGYLEGFATLYNDAADLILGIGDGALLPGIAGGLEGMWFIDACRRSSADNGAWIAR